MGKKTLAIIKPDSVEQNLIGKILTMITEAGFKIDAMKYTKLTREQASVFYAVHKERPFFNDLLNYITSGPIVPIALEKDNAVEDFRKLIGATDPAKADSGTVRNLYGTSIERNAVHGSDSDENAEIEAGFFFSTSEIVYNNS